MAFSVIPTRTSTDTAIPYQDTNSLMENFQNDFFYINESDGYIGIGGAPVSTQLLTLYSTDDAQIKFDNGGELGFLGIDSSGTFIIHAHGFPNDDIEFRQGSGSGIVSFEISNGNAVLSNAAVATTATDGFLYITSCPGTPTGTPTTHTGRVPMVYDSSNNKLYIYDGSWLDMT